ncbi:hypothetical protein ACW9I8_30425 [Pseudomonas reactans]|jgi:hypothetical protein|uniref:Uncharacterized protein n=2 Tax=Pseudomonas TaxID=286 RepID=A0A7Y8G9B3_9PSED|nr:MULTISPECIES: hypothetical protein [Pseudomonas]NWA45450.1 hypothetical protein [Pseudomonas reactans]NWB30633.1 hypothetical protein [Pseudomonas gingeri]NWC37042.1 hypothetical protein [Pseudomonas gingeri]NWC54901.1 hypothetical protein [Pseudomonas tolaasii]NWC75736.1 hypothetical protein [Pseudomonas sp. P7759]
MNAITKTDSRTHKNTLVKLSSDPVSRKAVVELKAEEIHDFYRVDDIGHVVPDLKNTKRSNLNW